MFHVGVTVTVLPATTTQMVVDTVENEPFKIINPGSATYTSAMTPPFTPLAHTPSKATEEGGKSSSSFVNGALMDESLTFSMDVFPDLMQPSPGPGPGPGSGHMRPSEVTPLSPAHTPSPTHIPSLPTTRPLTNILPHIIAYTHPLSYSPALTRPLLHSLPLSRCKHRSVILHR